LTGPQKVVEGLAHRMRSLNRGLVGVEELVGRQIEEEVEVGEAVHQMRALVVGEVRSIEVMEAAGERSIVARVVVHSIGAGAEEEEVRCLSLVVVEQDEMKLEVMEGHSTMALKGSWEVVAEGRSLPGEQHALDHKTVVRTCLMLEVEVVEQVLALVSSEEAH
jgi:hypothetical protein